LIVVSSINAPFLKTNNNNDRQSDQESRSVRMLYFVAKDTMLLFCTAHLPISVIDHVSGKEDNIIMYTTSSIGGRFK